MFVMTVMRVLGQISNPNDQIIQTLINASNDKDWIMFVRQL